MHIMRLHDKIVGNSEPYGIPKHVTGPQGLISLHTIMITMAT